MGLVNIKFRNTTVTINSNDEEKALKLADRLNARAESLVSNANNVTDNKLALIVGLILEEELERIQAELHTKVHALSEEETSAIMSETLDQLSDYIEHLAERIEKR